MADLPLRVALTSVLVASVDTGRDRHGLLVAMRPAGPDRTVGPRLPGPRVPAPRRPLDDVPGPGRELAAVHPLRPQFPPGGDGPSAA